MIALNLQAHTGNVDEDLVSYITAWGFARLPAAHKFDRPAVKVVMQRQETQNAQPLILEKPKDQKGGAANVFNNVTLNNPVFIYSTVTIGSQFHIARKHYFVNGPKSV
eukprot:TRINITY_DN5287_c0_g2_i1.p1 TRINITY_DN5287_c0_g2~~TRINITY_DN5287_c0_g2_i1.p1  ORF type:complete len:108 (-),score=12.82 TRINITY_DN5287_c0_g2_i1:47-370(-)